MGSHTERIGGELLPYRLGSGLSTGGLEESHLCQPLVPWSSCQRQGDIRHTLTGLVDHPVVAKALLGKDTPAQERRSPPWVSSLGASPLSPYRKIQTVSCSFCPPCVCLSGNKSPMSYVMPGRRGWWYTKSTAKPVGSVSQRGRSLEIFDNDESSRSQS